MTNQTPDSKIVEILGEKTDDGYTSMLPYDQAATQLQQLIIEERIEEATEALHQSYHDTYVVKYLDDRIADLQYQLNKEVDNE